MEKKKVKLKPKRDKWICGNCANEYSNKPIICVCGSKNIYFNTAEYKESQVKLNLWVSEEINEKIRKEAELEDRSVSSLLRRIIDKYFDVDRNSPDLKEVQNIKANRKKGSKKKH